MAEKTMHELAPDLRRMHTKAVEAAQRENDDYALALFCQVLEKEPSFFEGRKALRAVQARKSAGASTGFFKKMMSSAGSSPQIGKAKLALNNHPAEAMAIVEQVLNSDPNNSFAHRIIVEAASVLDLPQTAVLSLEILVRNSPKDKALVVEFANLAAETGVEAEAAEKYLNELIRTTPYDPDLQQAQKNLSAHRTLDEGGYAALEDGKGSFRDVLRNKEEAVSLEQEKRVQKTEDVAERLIGEYEARLEAEPDNLKMMRSLAELYTQKSQFSKALALYERIKQNDVSSDAALDRAIADTTLRQFDFQLAQLNPFDADHATQVEKIKADKAAFQMAECQKRAEKYPTDLAIRFELGQLYFQAGKIGEAIAEFQKAQANPNKRLAAMSLLAQCFAKRGMNDSAVRTLQNAIKEKPGFDEEKKDLIYHLGCVFEKMGKKAEAIEQFLIIYESDVTYRDVGAKVDAHYAGQ
ncbi:MAG TPA: tetratricopeptide repeat protein [bacterium]|jgi:tetratricopeptide (TPR) repeat protein|nr:tetratricopeptide repeat protein [bacterium]